MENKVGYLAGWGLWETFFFFLKKRSCLLIPTLAGCGWFICSLSPPSSAWLLTGDLQTDMIVIYSLASRNRWWEILFMVMVVMVMIIDSHYYKHHYYLVLINNTMKGALKNTELDPVLANGLIRKEWQEETPGLGEVGKIHSGEIQLTKQLQRL